MVTFALAFAALAMLAVPASPAMANGNIVVPPHSGFFTIQ